MATVSGTEFLSKVSTSTSGSAGGFRQNDPSLRKWQSLSHLVPEGATRTFPPYPRAELRAARGESSFRQAEGVHWLQDAHERLDTQLDRLRTRNSQLSYNITTAQLLDMKHKLSETIGALVQEKEAAKLSQFEKGRKRGELHDKVLQLEKDLMQMRCTLKGGSSDQPTETIPMSQEDFNRQERQKVDTELCKLRAAVRDAEARAKTQEEEHNQALQKLQTSTETQRMLLNQREEMNQKRQNQSEVQEQLIEANNKISQACLDKAILSTHVLKMEDNVKELKAKLTGALSHKDLLIQEKADLHQRAHVLDLQLQTAQQSSEGCYTEPQNNKQDQETVMMKGENKALREANEKLTCELEMIKQELKTSQSQLQEVTAERVTSSKQITAVEAERSQLIREKEELLIKMNEGGHDELEKMKEKCRQLRESLGVLELEKQKLQDLCQCLEAEVPEKREKQQLQEEEHRKQDAVRVQSIGELKAAASHWAEKWQKVALTLQSTQEELEELKRNNSRNKKESDSLLQTELDACKRELERSRSQALLHRYKVKGGEASVQTEDTETQTVLSQSSLLWEPPSDSHGSQNKAPQASEDDQDGGGQANISTIDSLKAQLEDSRRGTNKLPEEETLSVQKLQTLGQLYPVKDEKPSVEGRKDKINVETDQQRRMVTEQLKSLFKGQERKEVGQVHNRSAAGQTGAYAPQDWSQTSKVVRNPGDWRIWQQSSGLMPVFEEDEEGSDWPTGEEGKQEEEAHAEENFHNQSQQMSSLSADICNLKAKNENLLQATLTCKQPIQDCPPTAKKLSDKSRHFSDEIDLQQKRPPSFYPDGIFLSELVDICSPDEDEEEERDK
ncbi:centrosomal protein of 83 kDa [Anarrhichthys ocellatus]|uniref:centrosomal protein of 83 kDa n=1 Tax=Anarrhichthys ocellatus TaxID=433405 RepID=UPI0012ED8E75|nr:centrosomal protein of 83 kDa-like [Anarrhichthys ocellatus]